MEKTKNSYFKSLFKSVDVVLAVFLGLVFACALYYVDSHDLFWHFSGVMVHYFLPVCKSGLVAGAVIVFAYLGLSLKKPNINRSDAMLFGALASSAGGLISFYVNDCSKLMIIVWAIALAVSLIFIVARIVLFGRYGEENENHVNVKEYHALVARKYNPVFVYVIPAVLGICTLKYGNLQDFFGTDIVLYFVGVIVALSGLSIIYTALMGKKEKVNIIDLVLSFLFVYVMFIGGFIVITRTIRFDLLWAFTFVALFAALVVRSLLVSYNVPVTLSGKGPRNYYGALFAKYGATAPVTLGLLIGLLIDLCSMNGLKKSFDTNITSAYAYVIIGCLVVAGLLFLAGLFDGGLTKKKVNLVDFVVLTGIIASSVASFVLVRLFNTNRLCLVVIPFAVCALISAYRMFRVDVLAVEPVEDDSVALKLKVTNEEDGIHVYCNGKGIAIIDNKPEEVKEEKKPEVSVSESANVTHVVVEVTINDKDDEKVDVKVNEPKEEKVEPKAEEPKEEVVEAKVVEPEPEPEEVEEEVEEVEDDSDKSLEAEVDVVVEDERNKLNIAKRSFANKIKFTSDKTKEYYTLLKNELLSYRTKSKVSKKSESFRKKGLFAKLSVSGKSLRIHLPLDPTAYDENRFHQIDLGEKKEFKDLPFTMKIRSDLACRRAIELIQEVAAAREIKKNAKYEPASFAESLEVDGIAILEKVGELKLYSEVVSKQDAEKLTDKVLDLIPTIKMPRAKNKEMVNVYIDTALKYVENTISTDTLHAAQQIGSTIELINVKARNGLDKKITVVCDQIDPLAAKLVILTGGKVFKVVRK